MKLALIGGGFMGEAVLRAGIAAGVLRPADVTVAEVNPARAETVAKAHGVATTGEARMAAAGADVVLFAVKPQEFGPVAASLAGGIGAGATVGSIMAGVRIDTLASALEHERIVRIMPNTPAAIGEGVSVWTATAAVGESAREAVRSLLAAMGREVYVDDEKYLDMATALSGSGPGFVYLLIEAFIDAGVSIGFRRDVAELLAVQTFAGAARYAAQTGRHAAVLRNEVTSPGGTTAAGLQVLEAAAVRAAIIEAIEAAYERSRELGA